MFVPSSPEATSSFPTPATGPLSIYFQACLPNAGSPSTVTMYQCHSHFCTPNLGSCRGFFFYLAAPHSRIRKWQPIPVFLPGGFHGQRGLAGYSAWNRKEWGTTKWLTHTHARTRTHTHTHAHTHTAGMWDLSSPISDWTWAPCIRSVEP